MNVRIGCDRHVHAVKWRGTKWQENRITPRMRTKCGMDTLFGGRVRETTDKVNCERCTRRAA